MTRARCCASAGCRIFWIKVLFPDPLAPVIETKEPSGISTSIFLRLCILAPRMVTDLEDWRRFFGISIRFLSVRYCPVIDRLTLPIAETEPSATSSPPSIPAPGPMSMM